MSQILFTTCTVVVRYVQMEIARSLVHLVNSMPFNALFILIAMSVSQRYGRRHRFCFRLHGERICICIDTARSSSNFSNITYSSSAIIASNRFVGIIYHFNNLYVSLFISESWHCYLRTHTHSHSYMDIYIYSKMAKTNAHQANPSQSTPIHWYTQRIRVRLHSEYQIGWRQKLDVNTRILLDRKEENQYVAKNNKLWIPFIDFLASITFSSLAQTQAHAYARLTTPAFWHWTITAVSVILHRTRSLSVCVIRSMPFCRQ